MNGHYEIVIGVDIYDVGLIDNKAKIVWEKSDNGLLFNKKLDGSFILSRSTNSACYDAIKAMTVCDTAYLRITQPDNTTFSVVSVFNVRDIQYNDDKCLMTIKPRYYDFNNIDSIMDKDLNIINDAFDTYNIQYNTHSKYEYVTYTENAIACPDLWLYSNHWESDMNNSIPNMKVYNGTYTTDNVQPDGYTFYSQTNINPSLISMPPIDDYYIFTVSTTWFREVKYVAKAIQTDINPPPPQGTSSYPFVYSLTVSINGQLYHKYVRGVDSLVGRNIIGGDPLLNNPSYISWSLTSFFGSSSRTLTRARRLIDILEYFKTEFGCTTLVSSFFKDASNPMSGEDLRYLMIMQKSDAIFVDGLETSDPATNGIITFRQLMAQLWAMFQVTWVIKDDVLYIEHIRYFRYNFSYDPNATVGIDLTTYYPSALVGTQAYEYEQNIPLREKFTFMEAWNIDFVGTDIHYTDCLDEGDTITYSAEMITTDIDPTYMDSDASKDGFILFHCSLVHRIVNGLEWDEIKVVDEIGKLSLMSIANGHLSWANLHDAYWNCNRPIIVGNMNNDYHAFEGPQRNNKKQVPIEFPYCVSDFELVINDLVRTTMGDGEIISAEYNIKTEKIRVELAYYG